MLATDSHIGSSHTFGMFYYYQKGCTEVQRELIQLLETGVLYLVKKYELDTIFLRNIKFPFITKM